MWLMGGGFLAFLGAPSVVAASGFAVGLVGFALSEWLLWRRKRDAATPTIPASPLVLAQPLQPTQLDTILAELNIQEVLLEGGTYILSEIGRQWEFILKIKLTVTPLTSETLTFYSHDTDIRICSREEGVIGSHVLLMFLYNFAKEEDQVSLSQVDISQPTTLICNGRVICEAWEEPIPEDLIARVTLTDAKSKRAGIVRTRLLMARRDSPRRCWIGLGNATESEYSDVI